MHPTWLIETGVYRSEADGLLAEIRRQGMTGELVPYAALKQGNAPVVGGRALGDVIAGVSGFAEHEWERLSR